MKVNDVLHGIGEGLKMALNLVKDGGVEALENEIRYRGVSGVKTPYTRNQLQKMNDEFIKDEQKQMYSRMMVANVLVLHKVYGFGNTRINKFIKEFNFQMSCISEDYLTWEDLCERVKEETGLEFFNGENKGE